MTKHIYIRAYMAGSFIPTLFLLVVMTVYCTIRYAYNLPVPIERVIVFPMAAVPNLWGLWNVLYVAFFSRRHVSLGLYGGALPLVLGPLGYAIARLLDFPVPYFIGSVFPIAFPIGLALYYLAWKYIVGFLNAELGIA
jgi:hypothetical protein